MGLGRVPPKAKHVNVLAASVSRNLKMPHEIVCVTDMPEGIDGGIRIVPLWDDLRSFRRCFVRLKAFAPQMAEVLGPRFVSIDLDTVVTGPLDHLFDRPEPFVAWQDQARITPYCGAQWMLTAGAHPEVWETFNYDEWQGLKAKTGYYGSDQAWMAYKIPGAPVWTKEDGVYSFRLNLLRLTGGDPVGKRLKSRIRSLGGCVLPENASIVHFHGLFDPSMIELQQEIPWISQHWRAT